MKLRNVLLITVLSFTFWAGTSVLIDKAYCEEKEPSMGMKEEGTHEGSMMEGETMGMEDKTMDQKAETGAVKVNNPICPVSGQKVGGSMGPVVEYEYKGKIYNFCCTMCLKDFQKDPEKYVKIVNEMMAGEKTQETDEGHEEHEH